MIPFRKSIGFRLLCVSLILLALPLLVDSFILVQQRYKHELADAKRNLVEVARGRELPLAHIQPLNKPLMQVLTTHLKLATKFPTDPDPALDKEMEKLASVGDFSGMFTIKITPEGRYIVTASSLPEFVGRDYTDFFRLFDLFQSDAVEKGFSSYISYNSETLEPYFIVAQVVYSPETEKPLGVLVISADILYKLNELLKQDTQEYPVNFALLLPSSVVFAATDPKLRFQYFLPLRPEYKRLFLEEEALAKGLLPEKPLKVTEEIGYPFMQFEWDGAQQVGYLKQLSGANFSLLAYAEWSAIFRSPLASFFNLYLVYGLILLIGGLAAYFITRRMARPMRTLSLTMLEIQKGDLAHRYKRDFLGFEINDLGHVFNQMVDALLQHKKAAEEERVQRETFERELNLGREVQWSLLPHTMPDYPGVEIAEIYIPAREVGGDFYDVFVKDQSEELVLAVADASGKGVQACFYSMSVRNMLRTYAKEYDNIGHAMAATNNLFRLDTGETGMFVTVLMALYNGKTKELNYSSAGHNAPLVRRANGEVEVLRQHGIAMGVLESKEEGAERMQLASGDTVVFYTDGVTEAHNEAFELYDEERLAALVAREGGSDVKALAKEIVDDVNRFAGNAPQHDDITLLVMRIK